MQNLNCKLQIAKCKMQKLLKSNPLLGEPAPNEVRGARGGFIKGKRQKLRKRFVFDFVELGFASVRVYRFRWIEDKRQKYKDKSGREEKEKGESQKSK